MRISLTAEARGALEAEPARTGRSLAALIRAAVEIVYATLRAREDSIGVQVLERNLVLDEPLSEPHAVFFAQRLEAVMRLLSADSLLRHAPIPPGRRV